MHMSTDTTVAAVPTSLSTIVQPYTNIVPHRCQHQDEAFSIWSIQTFKEEAEKVLPGISTATVDFSHEKLPFGAQEKDYPGMLFIGWGGGRFDEHGSADMNQCAATRVADFIGVRNHPGLQRLLRMVLEEDRGTRRVKNSLGEAINLVSRMFADAPQKTVLWTKDVYDRIFNHDNALALGRKLDASQHLNFDEVRKLLKQRKVPPRWFQVYDEACAYREECKEKARAIWKSVPIETYSRFGQPITLAVVRSDNDYVNPVGYGELGVDVIIQVNPTGGNVQVFTMQKRKLCLKIAAGLIRRRELELGGAKEIPSAEELRMPDTDPRIKNWHLAHFDVPFCPILFNGNRITHTNVPPTRISVKELKALVIEGLELRRDGK